MFLVLRNKFTYHTFFSDITVVWGGSIIPTNCRKYVSGIVMLLSNIWHKLSVANISVLTIILKYIRECETQILDSNNYFFKGFKL